MSESNPVPESAPVESPPPSPQPPVEADDARASLHRLAQALMQNRNRKFLIEYLRLRRLISVS